MVVSGVWLGICTSGISKGLRAMWSVVVSGSVVVLESWAMMKLPERLSTVMRSEAVAGIIMGRTVREWDAMGVSRSVWECGSMMGPPQLSE